MTAGETLVPDQDTEKIRIIPLGGLGEIGMNAMVIAYGDEAIMVDCGVLFPDADMLGVDVVIPDFTVLRSLNIELLGYVITHGHEDHIGALPYALPVVNAPIFASRFTAGLIKHKLDEWGFKYDLNIVKPRDVMKLGPFELEFMRVTHSIPDGLAIAITTPIGTVIHTGDFKIDQTPVDQEKTDLARFAQFGEQGVLALLSDSTNSENEGVSLSESAIAAGLESVIRDAPGRIFLASFASHIHRIQQICDISHKHGRKIVLNGRSMINNVRMARELGYLKAPDDWFASLDDVDDIAVNALTVLTTGSQAEPTSALTKLSVGENQNFKIRPGDSVIFSSRSIPGNERSISKAINGLTRQGAKVHYGSISPVHTSGHAHKEEQRLMINLVKPRYFIPIHGELRHLTHHADTARGTGMLAENVHVIEDGQSVEFLQQDGDVLAKQGDRIEARKIMVDGKGIGDVNDIVLRDRHQLANAGMCIFVLTMDQAEGSVVGNPEILTRGIVEWDTNRELFDDLKHYVMKEVDNHTTEARRDRNTIEDTVRSATRRFFRRSLERKPVVLPLVIMV